jgi:hypothetical protein
MSTVIVVPETDGFKLDVSHNDTVWINSNLGVPDLAARGTGYLAPCWLTSPRGVRRIYHILSATPGSGTTPTVIRLGHSFVLGQLWDRMGQHRRFEYHPLSAFGMRETSPGMLGPAAPVAAST